MTDRHSEKGSHNRSIVSFRVEKEKMDILSGHEFEIGSFSEIEEVALPRELEWYSPDDHSHQKALSLINSLDEGGNIEAKRRIAKKALSICPECIDAWRLLALSYRTYESARKIYIKAIEKGRELYADYISQAIGSDYGLWMIEDTKPFLILMLEFAQLCEDFERYQEQIKILEDIIELNASDNLEVRGRLLHLYLKYNQLDDAGNLLDQYCNDGLIDVVYGRALYQLILSNQSNDNIMSASNTMAVAVEKNPFVPLLFIQEKAHQLPQVTTYRFGSSYEALSYIQQNAVIWFDIMQNETIPYFQKWIEHAENEIRKASDEDLRDFIELFEKLI